MLRRSVLFSPSAKTRRTVRNKFHMEVTRCRPAYEHVYGDPYLDAKYIMGSPGELWILPNISTQIEHIDRIEVLRKVLPHAIKGNSDP